MLLAFEQVVRPLLPFVTITAVVWLTYLYSLKTGFVSDDLDGIANYDGKLQGKQYGMISRWVRFHIAGGLNPSKHKFQDGSQIPQGKIPLWHHVLSITVFNLACLFLYAFLSDKFSPRIALLTVCLFAVHPICTQAVAWCSGLGYPLSLLWACLALNLVSHVHDVNNIWWYVAGAVGFALLQFLAIHAQFATMMLWTVLLFFGYWQFAILGFIISILMGFDIIKQTIKLRSDEFKKQMMGASTLITPRKLVFVLKTFMYYLRFTLWPHPMGLYHIKYFHFNEDVQRINWAFLRGLFAALGLLGIFILSPSTEVRFSILWFVAFSCIFYNVITIQQALTERYIFIPTIGTCLLLSYLTQGSPLVYGFIFGAYIVRTWKFLPTYDNELRFYQSNVWEFPASEVAYGNLGVTYLRLGMVGSAMDAWHTAIRINPDYDVPYYNIFSNYRANADMSIQNGDYAGGMNAYRAALPYLEKTLSCKVCHFPDMWKTEHENMLQMLKNPAEMLKSQRLRLLKLESDLAERLSKLNVGDDARPVQVSIDNTKMQIQRLDSFMRANSIEHANP